MADRVPGPGLAQLVVTGGGTGGHVIPALNIARAAIDRFKAKVLYVGTTGNLEERMASEAGIPFVGLKASGFMSKGWSRKAKALFQIPPSVLEARSLFARVRPDLVIGTGGYVQIPAVLAARMACIPSVLIEPNVVTGWANRLLGPIADLVVPCYGTSGMTGVPLASDAKPPEPKPERFRPPYRILVSGGSQGALRLNRNIPRIFRSLDAFGVRPEEIDILHQTGEKWKEETESSYRSLGLRARVAGFVPDLLREYGDRCLVIARSGAMSVAEITFSGTPAIYVPYPHAVSDHQTRNASHIRDGGGGWLWPDESLEEVEDRARDLAQILKSPQELHAVAVRAWRMTPGRPAVRWLEELVQETGSMTARHR
jgi:UDP-N-acetylglucosamine--N-acetylmuramyl-(pentapeptide) pyrophosphoryl-undecaprenol N-acetylglucosamine transferase